MCTVCIVSVTKLKHVKVNKNVTRLYNKCKTKIKNCNTN